jgi:hypothetical protein
MIQPAWMRASSVFTYTNSVLPEGLRRLFNRIVTASEAALNVLPALLTPASVVALVLGLWRVSSDLGWTEEFLIANGLFSHWQVWIALAIVLQIAATSLAAKINSNNKISEEN